MALKKRYMMTMKRSCSCSMPGVWRAVAHNAGAAVIFHSPRACGHVTREMDLSGHYLSLARGTFVSGQHRAPLITSNLTEEHAIFGGTEQLRRCIEHVAGQYKPEYILIANSCVSGVIGDDTSAIAQDAEAELGIPVMTVPCSGFLDGEYHAGFYHAAMVLADRFMQRQPVRANTVTLLGDRGGPQAADAREMKELLAFFDMEVQGRFPGFATIEDMKNVPASALCIPLGGRPQSYEWMRHLAAGLEERFGIPFLDHDFPVGWMETRTWLNQLGELLGKEKAAALAVMAQQKRLEAAADNCRSVLQANRITVGIGRPLMHFHPGWVLELLTLTGAAPEKVILYKGLTDEQKTALRRELAKVTAAPVVDEGEAEALPAKHLLLTTHELEDEDLRQFQLPVLPPLGVGGMIEVLYKLARLARQSGRKGGGLQYGW